MSENNIKVIAKNRKARHEYFIEEIYEAGIELHGTEVKSIRQGKVNIRESYASVDNGEVILKSMHISPYEQGNIYNKDPLRHRRLLLHRRQINKLIGATQQEGFSLIPLQVYFKGSLVKIELALAKGKKIYDKRADIADRDAKRNMDRTIKEENQYLI